MVKKILRYFGMAEEDTFGTPVEAIAHLDISGCTLDAPNKTTMTYKGGMGRSQTLWRPDFYSIVGNVDFAPDLKTIGYFLKWVLGGYVYTAAAPHDVTIAVDTVGGDSTTIKTGNASIVGATHLVLTTVSATSFVSGTNIRIGTSHGYTTEYRTIASVVSGTGTISFATPLENTHTALTPVVEIDALPTEITHHRHEFYGTDNYDLPSFTARVGKDQFEHTFVGCKVSSFGLKIDTGLAKCTIGVVGQKDQRDTLKEVAALLIPAEYPLAYYEANAYIDAANTDISPKVKSLDLQIKNAIAATDGKTIGSRFPSYLYAGDRETTLAMTMNFDDMDMCERYWGGTLGPADEGQLEFPMKLLFSRGDWDTLEVKMPKVLLESVKTTASGRDLITQDITCTALLDTSVLLAGGVTSVSTEILATLINEQGDMS